MQKKKENITQVCRDQLRCSTLYDKMTSVKHAVAEATSIKQTTQETDVLGGRYREFVARRGYRIYLQKPKVIVVVVVEGTRLYRSRN